MNQEYKITKISLQEKDFWNMMFFFPPSCNPEDRFEYDDEWCAMKISDVINSVFKKNGNRSYSNTGEILDNIMPDVDRVNGVRTWFKRLVALGYDFDYGKMPRILIRNCEIDCEKKRNPGCSFRVEDGNHRSVVYGLWLKTNGYRYEDYPMIAVHSNSFYCAFEADKMKEVLKFDGPKDTWKPWKPAALEDNGTLKTEQAPDFNGNDPLKACDAIMQLRKPEN